MDADGFRDRNQRYSYLVACENARRILAYPAILTFGREHLDRFVRGVPPSGATATLYGRHCSTKVSRP